jgi:Ca-activated chloride channel homolog
MRFENPAFLLLILFPVIYLLLKYNRRLRPWFPKKSAILYSSIQILPQKKGFLEKLTPFVLEVLLLFSLTLFIIALARPLGGRSVASDNFFGIDIVLAMDVSGSMQNVDGIPGSLPYRDLMGQRVYYDHNRSLLQYNRLNSAKKVIKEYIDKQTYNRTGVVIFAGYSYTRCPLTLDRKMLEKIIDETQFDPGNDGTAIGMGLATAVNRLKKSSSKSKVIILLTDGINNSGMIDPLTAAKIARDYQIRVYAIGLGNPSGYLQPASVDFNEYTLEIGEGLDEKMLQSIADTTGGKFYRAYDPNSLKKIYDDIDKLEKSRIEVKRRVLYTENFLKFLTSGFILLAGFILLNTVVMKIP